MIFLKENKLPLFIVATISTVFLVFMIFTFTAIKPGAFLSALNGSAVPVPNERVENWKPVPLANNFFSFFTNGVSFSMVAPNSVKILTHPTIQEKAKILWPGVEILIFLFNALLFWFAYKYSSVKEKWFIAFLSLAVFITISEVIIARPDHSDIPDFDYRYAGAAYYFYSLFIALSASIFLKTKNEYGKKIILPLIIIILALQQIFSFHALRLKNEAIERKSAFVKLEKTFLPELDNLSKKGNQLVIPNLSGGHIYQTMSGYTLADYLLFFNKKTNIGLVQNIHMPPDFKTNTVKTVDSIRTATSREFKESLKKSGAIRSYYSSPAWMIYGADDTNNIPRGSVIENKNKVIKIKETSFDPEKLHTVGFSLYTDNTSGNLYLSFYFKNDFGMEGEVGKIRIDDYAPYSLQEGKRLYNIETDLLQIYAYSLSNKVSNLTLYVPEEKNAFVNNIYIK